MEKEKRERGRSSEHWLRSVRHRHDGGSRFAENADVSVCSQAAIRKQRASHYRLNHLIQGTSMVKWRSISPEFDQALRELYIEGEIEIAGHRADGEPIFRIAQVRIHPLVSLARRLQFGLRNILTCSAGVMRQLKR